MYIKKEMGKMRREGEAKERNRQRKGRSKGMGKKSYHVHDAADGDVGPVDALLSGFACHGSHVG